MVDSFNPNNEPVSAPAAPMAAESGNAGFLATRSGKLIVGGIALVAILLAAGGIMYYFLTAQPADPEGFVTPGGSTASTSTAGADTTITVPPVLEIDDTFMFRNVFNPSVKPAAASSGGSGGTDGGTDGSTDDIEGETPGTLYLLSMSTQDGETTATFRLNGTEYTVGPGERLGDTPWSVVSISSSTVVLLYGDTRVTISLGQGVSK